MKTIIGYSPVNAPYPSVLMALLTEDGMADMDGNQVDGEFTPIKNDMTIRDDEWLGVNLDGELEVFKISEEKIWKSKMAQLIVNNIQNYRDPRVALSMLQTASWLVGVDLKKIIKEIEQNKTDGESFGDTWKRMNKRVK